MNRFVVENLFGVEGLNIAWYGVIIACGALLGGLIAAYRCKHTGFDKEHLLNFALIMAPVCIVCARAYYVIFEWDSYKNDIWSIFQINKGGLAIYGGVIGGVVVAFLYCKFAKHSFLTLADTAIPSLVLGQSIGRWGNFINQEAYGNQITNPNLQFFPYGVYIEDIGQLRQATFFYESASNLILFAAMLICYPHFKRKGYLLPFYMIGYGIIRFFVEGLRADSLYLFPGLRISQALSLVLVFAGIGVILWIRKSQTLKGSAEIES